MSAIEQFVVGNLTVAIHPDQDPESPRDWDNVGTMVCWHRNYRLGDKHEYKTPQDFIESDDYKTAAVILPLRLYDHSGITMSVGSGPSPFDPGGWDSGQVGWIFVGPERAKSEWGDGPDGLAKADKYLRGEVETYDQFLTGAVYGFVIKDESGNQVDSCWGHYGMDYAKEAATEAAKVSIAWEAQEVEKIARCLAL